MITNEEFLEGKKFPEFRKNIIKKITVDHPLNWQCVETPYDIVGEMVGLIPICGKYIVFFSLEFLEVMVMEKGINSERILFVADNELEAKCALVFYNVKSVVFAKTDKVNAEIVRNTVIPNGVEKFLTDEKGNEVDMKFGTLAILANFPYQDAGMNPIYHNFIEGCIDSFNPNYLVSVNPSRWMSNGKGLDAHRERMMNDRRMKKIVHFAGEREVFSTVSIKGGVNYFLWQNDYNGECEFTDANSTTKRFLNTHDIILTDNNAFSILDKVQAKTSNWISQKCLSRKPFGLVSNFSDFKTSGVKCISQGKKVNFVDPSAFTDKGNVLGKWKVCMSKATSEGNLTPDKTGAMSITTNMFVLEPNAICTETYLVVNAFSSKSEAENFLGYIKTKFFRFMLGIRLAGNQNISKDAFAWCPDMGDYSSVWTDKQLFSHFGILRNEQSYIEGKIKKI